jgi:hypothetical protein
MSIEKQIEEIEEMTVIVGQHTGQDTMWEECHESAEALYNAGYRKQKEGEWIRRYSNHTDHLGTFKKYDGDFCSVCGELGGFSKFCPDCGARMKGENK